MDGQVSLFAPDTSCGRTSPEHSAATRGKTLRQSLRRSSASSSRKPPVLMCLQRGGRLGEDTTTAWVDDGAWLGECMTRNTGECPNVAVESRLSQILEETPPAKYSLTAKACLGILRRAERRGKDLPELLKEVLIRQSQGASPQEQTEAPAPTEAPTSYVVRIRGGCDGGGKGALVQTEKSGTLGTGNDQTIFAAIPINDKATRWQGGGESRNHDGSGNGLGIGKEGDPSPTLTAGDRHGVMAVALDMTHACNVIRECREQVPALQARMGTGGNQVPLTYQMNGFGDYRAAEVASSCKQRDFKDSTDLAITHMVVRRLTPMECERLQGFPDGWTDIGDWVKTDKRGRKIKVKGSADSPRYKALGNSIALPFWNWMLRRMARYLPEGATLGSLFDGIGGFPLIWERIHGEGTARWASEIEQFPIAVTKIRFPEEREDGI